MFELQSKTVRRKFLLLTVLFLCLAGAVYSPSGRTAEVGDIETIALPNCERDEQGNIYPVPCYDWDSGTVYP
jgi:hypothetical protein